MSLAPRFFLFALIIGLAGCASTTTHYYTLVVPASAASTPLPPSPFLIDVMSVGVPVQIDQPQWVVRLGDNNVGVLEGERWGAPLSDEIRSALSAALAQRLNTLDISGLAQPPNKPVLRIKVQVRRLDNWPGQKVELHADWSLSFTGDTSTARLLCQGRFREDAPGGYAQLANAQQRVVAVLGEQVAEDARRWSLSRSSECADPAVQAEGYKPSMDPLIR
ncbi:PqiC family protein [Pseudomonas farris]